MEPGLVSAANGGFLGVTEVNLQNSWRPRSMVDGRRLLSSDSVWRLGAVNLSKSLITAMVI